MKVITKKKQKKIEKYRDIIFDFIANATTWKELQDELNAIDALAHVMWFCGIYSTPSYGESKKRKVVEKKVEDKNRGGKSDGSINRI